MDETTPKKCIICGVQINKEDRTVAGKTHQDCLQEANITT